MERKFIRNENNYLARQKTSLRLPDCCCHCERDFRVIFIRIYDTKSEPSARGQIKRRSFKNRATCSFLQRNNMTENDGLGNIINYLQRCKTIAEGNVNYMGYLFKICLFPPGDNSQSAIARSLSVISHRGRPIKITVSDPPQYR